MAEKSKTLDQFEPSGFGIMVCIETANARKDFVRLKPQESKSLSVSITM